MRCSRAYAVLFVVATSFVLASFAQNEMEASFSPNDMTLANLDDVLLEEMHEQMPRTLQDAKTGDLTEIDVDAILSESRTIEDDIAVSYSMMLTSNATGGNVTGNATASKKPAAKPKPEARETGRETQIITQRFGGIDTSKFKDSLKKIYELGFCIALGVYDASAKTCSASVTSSVVAPAATGIVPETEFMEAATTGSVSMQATTNNPAAAQNAEGMTAAKFIAGAQTALTDTGATLPAGSAIASADSITVSKPTVTAKKEDSAAPAPAQVASLALVFGIVAATNSLFA